MKAVSGQVLCSPGFPQHLQGSLAWRVDFVAVGGVESELWGCSGVWKRAPGAGLSFRLSTRLVAGSVSSEWASQLTRPFPAFPGLY